MQVPKPNRPVGARGSQRVIPELRDRRHPPLVPGHHLAQPRFLAVQVILQPRFLFFRLVAVKLVAVLRPRLGFAPVRVIRRDARLPNTNRPVLAAGHEGAQIRAETRARHSPSRDVSAVDALLLRPHVRADVAAGSPPKHGALAPDAVHLLGSVAAVGHAHERLDPVLVRPKNAKRRVGFETPQHDVVARGHAVGDDAEHPVAVVRRRVKRSDGKVTKTTHSPYELRDVQRGPRVQDVDSAAILTAARPVRPGGGRVAQPRHLVHAGKVGKVHELRALVRPHLARTVVGSREDPRVGRVGGNDGHGGVVCVGPTSVPRGIARGYTRRRLVRVAHPHPLELLTVEDADGPVVAPGEYPPVRVARDAADDVGVDVRDGADEADGVNPSITRVLVPFDGVDGHEPEDRDCASPAGDEEVPSGAVREAEEGAAGVHALQLLPLLRATHHRAVDTASDEVIVPADVLHSGHPSLVRARDFLDHLPGLLLPATDLAALASGPDLAPHRVVRDA